jgi:hypothetical protein
MTSILFRILSTSTLGGTGLFRRTRSIAGKYSKSNVRKRLLSWSVLFTICLGTAHA